MKSVRCSEFRGGRFSEVANVLHKRDFQSVTATLSAVGSVSASRSVRSGRFYCKCIRKINAVKHGVCLETSFQSFLYRLYRSFRSRLSYQSFRLLVAVTPARLYAYTLSPRDLVAFPSVSVRATVPLPWLQP